MFRNDGWMFKRSFRGSKYASICRINRFFFLALIEGTEILDVSRLTPFFFSFPRIVFTSFYNYCHCSVFIISPSINPSKARKSRLNHSQQRAISIRTKSPRSLPSTTVRTDFAEYLLVNDFSTKNVNNSKVLYVTPGRHSLFRHVVPPTWKRNNDVLFKYTLYVVLRCPYYNHTIRNQVRVGFAKTRKPLRILDCAQRFSLALFWTVSIVKFSTFETGQNRHQYGLFFILRYNAVLVTRYNFNTLYVILSKVDDWESEKKYVQKCPAEERHITL